MAYYPTIGGPGGIHEDGMSIFADVDLIPVCPRVLRARLQKHGGAWEPGVD